ncbi:putative membrane protein required for colicin V production [Parvularcula dongshanensis]|uniref:Putative membrane protein required for colicin V production n=1 Tax=Parvularcula dongshanensis TaxID=1173995 RepID=A0A840I4D7_9PROT|nr:putative membrane protein required for colicin V production [Parvularcula dongshanensis]
MAVMTPPIGSASPELRERNAALTLYDLFILGVLVMSIGFGWIRGVLREGVTLIAIAGGALLVWAFATRSVRILGGSLPVSVVVILVLFTLGFLTVTLALEIILRRFGSVHPSGMDRLTGAVFGALRGWFLVGLTTLGVLAYYDRNDLPAFLSEAAFGDLATSTADTLGALGIDGRAPEAESEDELTPL